MLQFLVNVLRNTQERCRNHPILKVEKWRHRRWCGCSDSGTGSGFESRLSYVENRDNCSSFALSKKGFGGKLVITLSRQLSIVGREMRRTGKVSGAEESRSSCPIRSIFLGTQMGVQGRKAQVDVGASSLMRCFRVTAGPRECGLGAFWIRTYTALSIFTDDLLDLEGEKSIDRYIHLEFILLIWHEEELNFF